MPLYEFKCPSCAKRSETIRSYEKRDDVFDCSACHFPMIRLPPMMAKMASRWGDSTWNRFDRGLGVKLESREHREKIMKQRGLVEVSEADIRKAEDKEMNDAADHERTMKKYSAALNVNNGDQGKAWADVFPVTE